ncbi:hypothetical protein B0H66DRAFT_368812 [Apodospora peruviana]|uniref:Uncharacterized protein n=1 Tax=Apodospora peruviana TaxID=516989 RepID=A0AAE0HW49_9PEZI|nr:hypothetical protein B0H66DRAFT_368812 [Apodospora peruviana]
MVRLFLLVMISRMEDAIVNSLLRSSRFHHGVRKIQRTVQDIRHGRNPDEPLREGEATEDPNLEKGSFFGHFLDELRNQIRGAPTEPPKK